MTEPDTLNPPATGDENEGEPRTGRRRARSNGAPATTYAYNVYLDGDGYAAVSEWESGDWQPADRPHGGDLVLIGTVEAATNDKAVSAILQTLPVERLSDRARMVRGAHEAFVDLEPIAIPVSRVETGRVPCPWRVERSCTIGGGR